MENTRINKILFLLMESDDYLTAAEIANELSVTERTIKSDISKFSDLDNDFGVEIKSVRRHGYLLSVIDEDKYLKTRKELGIVFSFLNFRSDSKNRTYELLRKIIVEKSYRKLEDIIEECFYTKSSTKENMKEVRKILDCYDLEIITKSESGDLVRGKEFNKRLLMVELYEVMFHTYTRENLDENFNKYFDIEEEIKLDIRHLLLDTLIERNIRVGGAFTQRMSMYIYLAIKRPENNYFVDFNDEEKEIISNHYSYNVSSLALRRVTEKYGYTFNDNEVLGLALLIMFWSDYSLDDWMTFNNHLTEELNEIIKWSMRNIVKKYNYRFIYNKESKNVIRRMICPIYYQLKFNAAEFVMTGRYDIREQVRISPMTISMAYSFSDAIKELYGVELSTINIINISNSLNHLINEIEYRYNKQSIIISSYASLSDSMRIERMIKRHYSDYFSCIKCRHMYEMRGLEVSDFDYAILNYSSIPFRFDIPMINIDRLSSKEQMDIIYEKVILKGLDFSFTDNSILDKKIKVYKDLPVSSVEELINMLAMKYTSEERIGDLKKDLEQKFNTSIYKDKAVIFLDRRKINREMIRIFEFKNHVSAYGFKIKSLILFGIDFKDNPQKLKLFNHLSRIIINNDDEYQKLKNNINKDEIIEMIKSYLVV